MVIFKFNYPLNFAVFSVSSVMGILKFLDIYLELAIYEHAPLWEDPSSGYYLVYTVIL